MRYFLLVLGLFFTFGFSGYDLNGDEVTDWNQTILKDENNDWSFDPVRNSASLEDFPDIKNGFCPRESRTISEIVINR